MSAEIWPAATDADDIEQQAALWIDRRDLSDWTVHDQEQLEAWLGQSMTHSIAFWRLNAAWKRTERLAALRPGVSRSANIFSRERIKIGLARSAGVLTIASLLSGAAFYFSRSEERSYTTPVGGREILSLADGSQIELNTDTALRISGQAGERKVWLDRGEAYFQIKHDATHPFTVAVGGRRVVDLGTKFSVRADTGRTEIALTEGSARVESANGAAPVTLKPGDVAIATSDAITLQKRSQRALTNELGWRRGVLIFSNTTLADAATQFGRYSQRRLVVNGSATSLKIDGTFPATDAAAFAAIAGHILNLHTRDDGSEIVISR